MQSTRMLNLFNAFFICIVSYDKRGGIFKVSPYTGVAPAWEDSLSLPWNIFILRNQDGENSKA